MESSKSLLENRLRLSCSGTSSLRIARNNRPGDIIMTTHSNQSDLKWMPWIPWMILEPDGEIFIGPGGRREVQLSPEIVDRRCKKTT